MGYVFAWGICHRCGGTFAFNPMRVPSARVNGVRVPFCRQCVEWANPIRIKNGLEPIVPAPDAYDACPEEELDYD